MRANCPECGQTFEAGERGEDKEGNYTIPAIPLHPPLAGKRILETRDVANGKVVSEHCFGSGRPV